MFHTPASFDELIVAAKTGDLLLFDDPAVTHEPVGTYAHLLPVANRVCRTIERFVPWSATRNGGANNTHNWSSVAVLIRRDVSVSVFTYAPCEDEENSIFGLVDAKHFLQSRNVTDFAIRPLLCDNDEESARNVVLSSFTNSAIDLNGDLQSTPAVNAAADDVFLVTEMLWRATVSIMTHADAQNDGAPRSVVEIFGTGGTIDSNMRNRYLFGVEMVGLLKQK